MTEVFAADPAAIATLRPEISEHGTEQGLSKVSVVLNFAADGGAAGFYHALERGYFREVGLDVTIEPSKDSANAITRTAIVRAGLADDLDPAGLGFA